MDKYFTQHHFAPRWASPAHHDAPAEHLTPKSTNTQSPAHHANASNHHRLPGHMHDTVSRFLQALNFHYGPDDYEVVQPHFDMVETKTCYAVYGELPGLGREDVAVEANDHLFTLTISGELKRPVPQEANLKDKTVTTTADTEGVGISHLKEPAPAPAREEPDASNTSKATPPAQEPEAAAEAQPKASVETEGATSSTAKPSTSEEPATKPAENADTNAAATNGKKAKEEDPKDQVYWHVKERRIGHFKRVFRFPVELVEMASIKASIHHGLLCVIVPKRDDMEAYNKKVEEARKVDIFQGPGGPDSTYPLFGYFF